MRFLSSQQALADAARFVERMQANFTGPWISLGCSYSGSLSAWFRAKYPTLVVGAVAPSGPVLATANFTQFLWNYQNVARSHLILFISRLAPACVKATANAFILMEPLLATSSGLSQLSQAFNACQPIRPQDVPFFKYIVGDVPLVFFLCSCSLDHRHVCPVGEPS
jgi:hypothetical protein